MAGESAAQSQGSQGFSGNPGGQGGGPPWGGGGNANPRAYSGPSQGNGLPPGAGRPSPASQGGADVVDFNAMLRQMQAQTRQETQALQGKYGELEGRYSKQQQMLDGIRNVFVPQGEAPDPAEGKIQALESELDHYLSAAMEAKERGTPIPLTTNLAIKFFQSQIELETERSQHRRDMAEMKQQLKGLASPDRGIDVQAFTAIDSHVVSALDMIYGTGEDYQDQKHYQFDAITKRIASEIKDLKKNEPKTWEVIRRDPRKQQALVKWAVEDIIPPRARQILQDDQIRREPMAESELWQAFREAGEHIQDPRERSQIRSQIRQEILARQAESHGDSRRR